MASLYKILEENDFKISTDTRREVANTVFFALKGNRFDGNAFIEEALARGAKSIVTERTDIKGDNICVVSNTLIALQEAAKIYRDLFNIPIIAIGGSNGKTTSKELIGLVLKNKFRVHQTEENLNNQIGLPLSILGMDRSCEIGVFEIGANRPGEHLSLLDILKPTLVIVTNNGMDHLEGFGSPVGVRKANKEIYDWAKINSAQAFVNKKHCDLLEDSVDLKRILYPRHELIALRSAPLVISFKNKNFTTNLFGEFNLENIELATAVGEMFNITVHESLEIIGQYLPKMKRSELVRKDGADFIVDCYNANPSSMRVSLESFLKSSKKPRGVILGDMLELGKYAENEHDKIISFLLKNDLDCVILVGKFFKEAIEKQKSRYKYNWFPNSDEARQWFSQQRFAGYTFLLKGSRGIQIEKVADL